ncbi:MAG: hypothetical protein K0S37_3713 [Microbacterium sp.]|jgi:hypothetical protein|nr:hypothetical protein [Microbacterium sp.]
MGFSMVSMRIRGSEVVDADRAGLATFLASEGLYSSEGSGELLRLPDGAPLAFDGHRMALSTLSGPVSSEIFGSVGACAALPG